ncbi:MAG: carbamoyltransferase N-terminal domain-containing protein, partial [Terracidiphilus sp.]
MKVIGISGLENAMPFKRAQWPGLEERELRIAQGMDAAAALIVDGEIVAAAEQERFTGRKHTGEFPMDAIRFCLAQGGLTMAGIDELAHGFDYAPYRELYAHDQVSAALYRQVFSREALLAQVRRELPEFPEARVHS